MRFCSNCLCFGHFSYKCQANCCKICSGRHSSLLHHKKPQQNAVQQESSTKTTPDKQQEVDKIQVPKNENSFNGSSIICANSSFNKNYVLLSTAIVDVQDAVGQLQKAQVILDSGSQCSFISENFNKKLGLNKNSVNISISGINSVSSTLHSKCNVLIKSTINNFQARLDCIVVPKITDDLPSHKFNVSDWSIPKDITLANNLFNISRCVDILIGVDLFWDVVCEGKISLGKNKPLLINTVFEYVVWFD